MAIEMNGLVKGVKVLGLIAAAVVGLIAATLIGMLIYGSIAEQAFSGAIAIPTSVNTSMATVVTSGNTAITSVFGPLTTLIALVVIVVLVIVFGFKKLGSGGSSGVN